LKKKHAIRIASKFGMQQKDVAELIGISVRTFQRQEDNEIISSAASENVLKLAELYETGLAAFDNDKESFQMWMNAIIPALNNEKPIDLLTSNLGIDLVREELLRIEYGIY
jgi:putative toxin-antitoxin system antitoxin component (TIGR02293 family)